MKVRTMPLNMNKLTDCTREQYAAFTKALAHDQSRPTEGNNISVMQWVNPKNVVIAQAIYEFGKARYQIKA